MASRQHWWLALGAYAHLQGDTLGIAGLQPHQKGKKILASNLQIATIDLIDSETLRSTVPNDTIRREIEQEKEALLIFLRKRTKNDRIQLQVEVLETKNSENFIYTPEEKLEHLISKYPAVAELKQKFSLDL